MAKTGTKRSKVDTKAYEDHMELEFIIEDMGKAMRDANLQYVGITGKMTPHIMAAWDAYTLFAYRTAGVSLGKKTKNTGK